MANPFINHVLELLPITWFLEVDAAFDPIDFWVIHVCAYYKAKTLVAFA